MALTTFAIGKLVFSLTARDERRSVFSLDTFNDRTFVVCSLLSAGSIVFATELRSFQHPRHRRADRHPVADLHRRGPHGPRRLRDPQVLPAPEDMTPVPPKAERRRSIVRRRGPWPAGVK
jgi:hypothetical protein